MEPTRTNKQYFNKGDVVLINLKKGSAPYAGFSGTVNRFINLPAKGSDPPERMVALRLDRGFPDPATDGTSTNYGAVVEEKFLLPFPADEQRMHTMKKCCTCGKYCFSGLGLLQIKFHYGDVVICDDCASKYSAYIDPQKRKIVVSFNKREYVLSEPADAVKVFNG